jgi:two-component system response regulator GlrR
VVPASLVQQALHDDNTMMVSLDEARRTFEHDYLVRLLRATEATSPRRHVWRSATALSLSYKLLQRHDLSPALFKSEKRKRPDSVCRAPFA